MTVVEYTNSTNEINSIYVCSNRGDGGSGIVALDNLHHYQGAPETLTTDGLRGECNCCKFQQLFRSGR